MPTRIGPGARRRIRCRAHTKPWFPRMCARSAENPHHHGGPVRMNATEPLAEHRGMSANQSLHSTGRGPSGEHIFFVLAVAFWVLVGAIVLGFFLPLVVGIALI